LDCVLNGSVVSFGDLRMQKFFEFVLSLAIRE
jgi:hypothetical protein